MSRMSLGRWLMLGGVALLGLLGAMGISGSATPPKPPTCVAGTALALSKDKCVACPIGKYTDTDGAQCTAAGCCLECPDGFICPQAGTTNPQMCKANTAAAYDHSVCINCSIGFYSFDASQCLTSTNAIDSCCQLAR